MKATSTFLLREAKKHSVRYDADPNQPEPIASSIYISKAHFSLDDRIKNNFPPSIRLTVETDQ